MELSLYGLSCVDFLCEAFLLLYFTEKQQYMGLEQQEDH